MHNTTTDTLVIGAGQSGLATAHHLKNRGIDHVVIDSSPKPGGSWPHYYDSLTLFSPARFSALPGLPFPGNPERYPHRDEVVDYLTEYTDRLATDIRYGHRVVSITSADSELIAATAEHEIQARRVIVASGSFTNPHIPSLHGVESFTGQVLHAAQYRTPQTFAGTRVAVVGAGNSAIQIAAELAAVSDVSVYSRQPIRWQRQRFAGRDLHWWLTYSGVDRSRIAARFLAQAVPVLDDGRYRAFFDQGTVAWHPMFTRIEGEDLIGADGHRRSVDVLLFATGYRPHVPFLDGTPAVDAVGKVLHRGGVSTTMPGMGFVGLEHQRSHASATLRGVGRDADAVIRRLLP
ncbi:flavin-containing monooxygenase [Jonesia quinghaiensis]|uniref:flavin-containing monooxygenase n=1 Tax=Jonesia quinghaiensis TaxID=262806 RepID=UPI00056643CA|nr:NAD(P)-binding domain-containing protein [Jonesia quinghaiensis]